jgi:Cu/Ag efflux protein CusF
MIGRSMYPGKLTWFSLLAFILLAGLLAGCDEENQPQNGESGTPPKMLQGEVKSVNPDKRKLILRTSTSEEQGESTDQQGEGTTEQGTQTVPFKLAEDATITVLGEEADLTALKAGQQAEVGYSVREGGTNEAASVEVTNQPPEPKTATGEIKAVKADNRKVKLKPGSTEQGEAEQDTQTQKFKLRKNATVTVLGEEADVAALKAGQQAQIQYIVEEGINRARSVRVGETAAVSGPTPG